MPLIISCFINLDIHAQTRMPSERRVSSINRRKILSVLNFNPLLFRCSKTHDPQFFSREIEISHLNFIFSWGFILKNKSKDESNVTLPLKNQT